MVCWQITRLMRRCLRWVGSTDRVPAMNARQRAVALAAVLQLCNDVGTEIARHVVVAVRQSATIDWNLKECAQAEVRSKIRSLLARNDCPPDHEAKTPELGLQQAELFASGEVA